MKTINLNEFNGSYINLDTDFIPYLKIIYNPSKYFNKYETYYFYCKNGIKSKIVVEELTKAGYKAIQVKK